jgi:ABC-type uncharacterized transport system ATPase subunit
MVMGEKIGPEDRFSGEKISPVLTVWKWSDFDEMLDRFPRLRERHNQTAGTLSGGNAQKIIIARELAERTNLLVAAHPTRGPDIAASQTWPSSSSPSLRTT